MDEMIKITKSRYDELIEAEAKLEALERAGVDNWDGYDYAMEFLDEFNEFNDSEEDDE